MQERFATDAAILSILPPRDGLPLELSSLSQIRNVAILGSTGSIGRAALDVLSYNSDTMRLIAISCGKQLELLEQQISAFQPRYAFALDSKSLEVKNWFEKSERLACETSRSSDSERLISLIESKEVDTVVAAIVGIAGLDSALAAARSGKRLALANKESLVVSGALMIQAARESGAEILPVDSEHSAIFQALQAGTHPKQVKRVILTASGGPLRDWPIDKLNSATVENALSHPTWTMGRKITIDSATMMNKALEVIEAKWLFDLRVDQICVVVHPQSIIHSMVEFCDGSVIAQMSPPDMRLPIQYALTYPERVIAPSPSIDWTQPMQLDWKPADLERYPALELGFEVVKKSGSCGAVLNAANEAAVELFLEQKIKLTDITNVCRDVLNHHNYSPNPSLQELKDLDRWGRNEVHRWILSQC